MTAALILIDFQQGFDAPVWCQRNNQHAGVAAVKLLMHWRNNDWPLFHVRHLSQDPNRPLSGEGFGFRAGLEPRAGEVVIQKSVNSAFIGTDLEKRLRHDGIFDLVICGLTTPHCVSTTTRMAANLGFNVALVADACAAFTSNANTGWNPDATPLSAQEIHNMALSHLHGEFAQVVNSSAILSEGQS